MLTACLPINTAALSGFMIISKLSQVWGVNQILNKLLQIINIHIMVQQSNST